MLHVTHFFLGGVCKIANIFAFSNKTIAVLKPSDVIGRQGT